MSRRARLTSMRRDLVIVGLFALSGAAGLVYEVVWARQLVLVFGNTTQVVSAILTGFFAGMALAVYVGGRAADRIRRGLLLYGCLEVVVAVVALATPQIFDSIGTVYQASFSALETTPVVLFRSSASDSHWRRSGRRGVAGGDAADSHPGSLAREGEHLSTAFGRLYAANTIGAVFGCMIAGLVLIELLGLGGALRVGALCSATAGRIAIALHLRRYGATTPRPRSEPGRSCEAARGTSARPRGGFCLGADVALYQTLWTRLLADGTGNRYLRLHPDLDRVPHWAGGRRRRVQRFCARD